MELPNYTDYEAISKMNPAASFLAMEQAGLAKTFQQEKLAQEQERAKQMQLANIFSEQKNPLLVEEQRIKNLESQYGLPAKRIAGEIAEETAPQQKQLALRNAILNLKQADITEMERKARLMAYDPDPNVRAQGVELMRLTPEFIKLREEEAGKMAREKEQQRGAAERTGMQIGGQRQLEQMRIDAGKYAKTQGAKTLAEGVVRDLTKLKKASEQFTRLNRAVVEATQQNQPELAAMYQAQADAIEPQARAEFHAAGTLQRRLEGGEIVSTPRGESVPSITPPGATPQAKPPIQYQAGQTYTGKTGTYKYLGGDPKDKASWEKVK